MTIFQAKKIYIDSWNMVTSEINKAEKKVYIDSWNS